MLQSSDQDVEDSEIWKSGRHGKTIRSPSPHNAFKRWRKANQSKHAINGTKTIDSIKSEEEMSLLKFLAIVS